MTRNLVVFVFVFMFAKCADLENHSESSVYCQKIESKDQNNVAMKFKFGAATARADDRLITEEVPNTFELINFKYDDNNKGKKTPLKEIKPEKFQGYYDDSSYSGCENSSASYKKKNCLLPNPFPSYSYSQPCPVPLPPCPPRSWSTPLPPCPPRPWSTPCPPTPYPMPLPPCPPQRCPVPLPPCPPAPCPPRPYPNNCNYPPPFLPDLLAMLDSLYREKSIEAINLLRVKSTGFLQVINNLFVTTNANLTSQIDAAYATLNNNILGILTIHNANELNNVITSINRANADLQAGVKSLIATANASITSLITNLASTTSANIVAVVQNFTTPAGLLPQLLVIINRIPAGASSLFFTATQNEIGSLNSIFINDGQVALKQILAQVNSTNSAVQASIQNALASEISIMLSAITKFVSELGSSVSNFFDFYGSEVRRLVKESDYCNPCSFSPNYSSNIKYSEAAPVITISSTGGSNTITAPINPV